MPPVTSRSASSDRDAAPPRFFPGRLSAPEQLSDMKIVNRAKSMLMQYLNLTEEQAHRHIQKQAMDLRKTQRAVAEDILKTYQNTKEEE